MSETVQHWTASELEKFWDEAFIKSRMFGGHQVDWCHKILDAATPKPSEESL